MIHGRASRFHVVEVTIDTGATASTVARTLGGTLVAIHTPSELTGTAFAIHASADGETFDPVYADSEPLSVHVAASRYVVLDWPIKAGAVRIVSNAGSGEAATRIVQLVFDLEGA